MSASRSASSWLPRPRDNEVRDYWGELVAEGPAGEKIECPVKKPGWYKLYVYGKPFKGAAPQAVDPLDDLLGEKPKPSPDAEREEKIRALWGDVLAATTFVIFRNDPNFPALPGVEVPGNAVATGDEILRGVIGMGPQRHQARGEKVEETIATLEKDIALDKKYYLPHDPTRKRALMVAFGDGTKNLEGVRKIVERFQDDVLYWGAPQRAQLPGASPADFVEKELKPFYKMIKEINPKLKVNPGPGTVSYGPNLLPWIEGFFEAGGGRFIDAFSFHSYNCVNGDLALTRRTLIELNEVLKKHDAHTMEKWQTEPGLLRLRLWARISRGSKDAGPWWR